MKTFFTQAFTLARVSNIPTVWTNALAAWVINSTASPTLKIIPEISDLHFFNWPTLAFLLLGSSLIYAGGCTLNDAFDQKFDHEHNPQRPIPSNSISPRTVWILGICELIIGVAILTQGAKSNIVWVLALVGFVVFYDYIHKKWVGGIVIMGLCRFFLWMTAASTGENFNISPQTYLWGVVLGGYVIGISLFARGESKKRKTPVQYSILLLFGSPLLALAGLVYWNNLDPIRVFLINIVGLVAAWIAFTAIIAMRESKKDSIGIGVSRLLAGICALDATALAFYSPVLIAPTLCCLSIAVILQKKFAAT